jgi:hypothetical protein
MDELTFGKVGIIAADASFLARRAVSCLYMAGIDVVSVDALARIEVLTARTSTLSIFG